MKGKRSTFLKGLKRKNSNRSEARVSDRVSQGLTSDYPSSTKVGVGQNARVRRGYDVAKKKATQYNKARPTRLKKKTFMEKCKSLVTSDE